MIKSDFSALRSIVTHYMVVSKQPLVKLNRVHFRVGQTFSLTLNLTSADFCLLGFLILLSFLPPRDTFSCWERTCSDQCIKRSVKQNLMKVGHDDSHLSEDEVHLYKSYHAKSAWPVRLVGLEHAYGVFNLPIDTWIDINFRCITDEMKFFLIIIVN